MPAVTTRQRLWRMSHIVMWMFAGVGISLQQRLLHGKDWHSKPVGHKKIQAWLQELAKRIRLEINVMGEPLAHPHVQVANHISWLDVVALGANHPVNFVAKSEIASWPLVGLLARFRGTCFIKRGSVSSLRAILPHFQQHYEMGNNMVLFPEATTSLGDDVRPFHAALFQIMIDLEMPVQPVALRYNGDLEQRRTAAYIEDDKFITHLWSLCGCESISVDLHYLEGRESREKQRRLLANTCRNVVAERLFPEKNTFTQAA